MVQMELERALRLFKWNRKVPYRVLRDTISDTVPFCLDLTTTQEVLLLSTGLNQGPQPDEVRALAPCGLCSMPPGPPSLLQKLCHRRGYSDCQMFPAPHSPGFRSEWSVQLADALKS